MDSAARHRQDRPQEPSADAHQRQSKATQPVKSPLGFQLGLLLQLWGAEPSKIHILTLLFNHGELSREEHLEAICCHGFTAAVLVKRLHAVSGLDKSNK